MPIYEYLCRHCREKQEVIQKVSDGLLQICPSCHEPGGMEKTITAGAFHLKGGGWYKDLYASPKKESTSSSSEGSGGNIDSKSNGSCQKPT